VIHVGVTRSPTDAWVAQQLREATPYGQAPKYLIRDNDSKFGVTFDRVARTSGIKLLKTPYHAPRANAICERFLRSVRRECLDHLLILQEKQLQRVLNAYVANFNQARPHQGIAQQIPDLSGSAMSSHHTGDKVLALPVLGGLHPRVAQRGCQKAKIAHSPSKWKALSRKKKPLKIEKLDMIL
jgi:putative transposase